MMPRHAATPEQESVNPALTTVEGAQLDLRRAFVGGGPGLLVSGFFWLAAGLVANARGVAPAYILLFITGMLIFPSATLLSRFAFARQPAAAGNPMGRIALESTIAMIGGLVIAWLVLPSRPEWVFPIAAVAVGSHFFAFRSAYGDLTFWLLGALVTAVGLGELFGVTRLGTTFIFIVAALEVAFGLWLTRREAALSRSPPSPSR